MLADFLATHHDELVNRCKAKVAERPAPRSTAAATEFGVAVLIDQLVAELRREGTAAPGSSPSSLPPNFRSTAGKHGSELLQRGFTIDQVVHDYGDLCQAVTELAHEKEAAITVDEFHTFNRCLDSAIADAVTEFGRQRDQRASDERVASMNERLGNLAHELRNRLGSGMLAFQAIKSSNMTLAGATGDVLGRSLIGLRHIIDRSLTDVRLTEGLHVSRELLSVRDLLQEVSVDAAMEAKTKDLVFTIASIDETLSIEGDREMIVSAVTNLLQNAFKFTKKGGQVSLTAHAAGDRLRIDIEDACGGLPKGRAEDLFLPFEQRGDDRSGLGLGLSISRRAVEANGGTIAVRNVPPKGCVFTIDLPLRAR